MAKKMTKAEATAVGVVAIVALPIFAVVKLIESVGWIVPVLVVVAIIAAIAWFNHQKKQQRLAYLRGKYGDDKVVQLIFDGRIWQGQTAEQLQDSLGAPVDVDEKLLKTKSKYVFKYHHRGANRYGLRVTVENGIVVGWDQKS